MEILLLNVGKTSFQWIDEGISVYEKRLKKYIKFSLKSIPDIKSGKNITPDLQKEMEGKVLMNVILPTDYVILLDERGEQLTSLKFASQLEKLLSLSHKRIVFIIGGPYGFSKLLYDRKDKMISLSSMTFTHEMIKLFFVEQVYRAFTILNGEPYHHE